jgi:excisionase family DNA binding protein
LLRRKRRGCQMLSDDLIKGARDAAAYLGISERSVYHMTEKGLLPVIRKGRTLFYRKSDLNQAFTSEQPIAA